MEDSAQSSAVMIMRMYEWCGGSESEFEFEFEFEFESQSRILL